jgi:hypothetical protein
MIYKNIQTPVNFLNMKKNTTNLFIIVLLFALTNVLNAQCTKTDIEVPSSWGGEVQSEKSKTLLIEATNVRELKLSLYTSKGTKIFESTSSVLGASKDVAKMLDTGWDGTQLGEKLKAGFYVYTIEAECADRSTTIFKTGQIVLTVKS